MPTAIPHGSKRAPRVTAGSANHISAGLVGPPLAITAPASSSGSTPQAASNPEPGALAGLHEAIGDGEAAEAGRERRQPEPADLGAGGGQR